MSEKKRQTCCFTGHRRLPQEEIESIVKRLDITINGLIGKGVTDFISGGAIGFDLIAASLIIAKKEMGHKVRLIFALPYRGQDENWSEGQKKLYHDLLGEADEIIYVSEESGDGCMKKQGRYMINRSAYCICALLSPMSGTNQTARYARQKGLRVINVAD